MALPRLCVKEPERVFLQVFEAGKSWQAYPNISTGAEAPLIYRSAAGRQENI
jgi:hypothetical protein